MANERQNNLHQPEIFGCRPINPKHCKTCLFSQGKPPFEDGPEKIYCRIYSRDEGEQKPPEVYYEGAECEYHEPRK